MVCDDARDVRGELATGEVVVGVDLTILHFWICSRVAPQRAGPDQSARLGLFWGAIVTRRKSERNRIDAVCLKCNGEIAEE